MTNRAVWGWVRQQAAANQCLGTRATVRDKVAGYFTDLARRREEIKRRCRTVQQAKTDELIGGTQTNPLRPANADFALASV